MKDEGAQDNVIPCPPVETGEETALVERAGQEIRQRFEWLNRKVPGLLENLEEYTSPEFVRELMEALRLDGLIENTVDALDALLTALATVVGLRAGDLVGSQLKRYQKMSGSLQWADTTNVKNLMDAFARILKVSNELKDNAGFSKRARKELGDQRGDALQQLIERVMAGDGVPANEDMSPFYAGSVVKSREIDEGQFEVFRPANEAELTEVEEVELMAVADAAP